MRVYGSALQFVAAILIAISISTAASGATLRLWHKLDETSGTLAADSSANGNNGTYTGGPALGAAAPHRFGVYFAANGQYVIAPSSATLNALGAGDADFSVAFWIKPNGLTGDWRPMLHKGSANMERGPGLWLQPGNNRIHFRLSTTASSNEGTDSVANLPNGAWSHVACVKAGNKWRCYVNGVLDTEFTLSAGTAGNLGPLYVGDDPWYAGSKAWIDDVRLFEGALTGAEVKSLYGQVGYWKLDETTGTAAADSTNAGNVGTYTNGPLLNQSGIKGTAASFDGVDDYVGVPDNASLRATDAITMAAWIRPTASTNIDRIILNKEGEYEIAITNTNQIKWAIANTSPGWAWHLTGTFVPNDIWSHVVVTYDGVEAKTYLNGVLVETFTGSGNIGDAHLALNELRIGGRSNNPSGQYFGGAIDEVYVYTRAISAAEVVTLYGLVGHWKFAEGSGATAADSSGFSNSATLTGGAGWATDCAGNNALQTNGFGGIAQTNTSFAPPSEGTVAFWMRGAGPLSTRGRVMGVNGEWEIRQEPGGALSFDLGGSPYVGNEPFSTIDPVATNGRWYHIVATYSDADNSYSVYIDGQLRTSGISPVDLVPQAAAVLSFGVRAGSSEYWLGALRDVRIYNRRIVPSEIAELCGLMGYWKLDETLGTVAADVSGLDNNAALTGTTYWTTGPVSGAHRFNYTDGDDYFTIPNTSKLQNVQEGNYTLAAWCKPLSVPPGSGSANDASYGILMKNGYHVGLRYTAAQSFQFDHWLVGNVAVSAYTSPSFPPGMFYHVATAVNRSAGTVEMYVNGNLRHTANFTAGSVAREYSTVPWRIGIADPGAGNYRWACHGVVDDARIYNRVLCATEVLALYSAGAPLGVKIIKWVELQ